MKSEKIAVLLILTSSLIFFTWQYSATMNFEVAGKFPKNSSRNYSQCPIKPWNEITSHSVPNDRFFKKWAKQGVHRWDTLKQSENRLISAFVYKDHISVVTSSFKDVNRIAVCRYYDCNRNEILNSAYESYYNSIATVFCARRAGAEFVSLSSTIDEQKPHEPIPLTYRAYDEPVHQFAVCVGPLYGNESKWLEIAEYVEHYRLINVTYFYFSVFNLNEYDTKILSDYQRLGLAEVTNYNLEYENLDWRFHTLQIAECFQRSKHHAKWVVNMDIDERLTPVGTSSILDYLNQLPPNIGEVSFAITRISKTEYLPETYIDEKQLKKEMMFLKYNQISGITWYNYKGVVRPEKVAIPMYHWTFRQFPGINVFFAPKTVGYVRHYRSSIADASLGSNWHSMKIYKHFVEKRLESNFEEQLAQNVINRVKYVYEQRMVRCEEQAYWRHVSKNLFSCKHKNGTVL